VRRPEQLIHRAVVGHLQARGTKGLVFWHHPAGGRRSPIEARIFKGLGAKAGLPDLLILRDGRLYGLELKAAKGRTSMAQITMHLELERAGATMGTAYGLDEALAWLEGKGLLRGVAS